MIPCILNGLGVLTHGVVFLWFFESFITPQVHKWGFWLLVLNMNLPHKWCTNKLLICTPNKADKKIDISFNLWVKTKFSYLYCHVKTIFSCKHHYGKKFLSLTSYLSSMQLILILKWRPMTTNFLTALTFEVPKKQDKHNSNSERDKMNIWFWYCPDP